MSSKDTRLAYLQSGGEQSGRSILESGDIHNWADADYFRHRYDINRQSIQNGAVEIGLRSAVADGSQPFYYGLDVPEGRRFVLQLRELVLSQGRYEVDLVSASGGFTGGTLAYKKRLSESTADPTVGTDVYAGVTPSGTLSVLIQFPLVDTGTAQTGQARVGGAAALDEVIKSFTTSAVMLRVQQSQQTPTAYTSSILLIGWEEEA